MTADPYTDPSTGVLRNTLGITDDAALARAEADLSLAAIADLGTRILPGDYDLTHLQAFHREIFGDLYPWAGEIRIVAIAKIDLFCLPQHIHSYAAEVFAGLAKEEWLRGLNRTAFVDRFTHYFAEVNAIHPFREGHGRTQRAFFRQLAKQAGWSVRWGRLDAERNVETSQAALRGDNSPLRAVLDDLIASA